MTNSLLSIMQLMLQQKAKFKLNFVGPRAGKYTYSLYYMSNSYMGWDQEYNFSMEIGEATSGDEGSGLDSN